MKLLAMDFDGVIADSILECAITGYNGYQIYCGNNVRINTPEEIASDQLITFRKMRPYIRSGEDYIYLFHALNDNINISTQEEFDKFQRTYRERRELYHQLFYSARQILINSDHDNWINFNPLYNGMGNFLRSIHNRVHIVSTKTSKYINDILETNGIKINSKNIHDASGSISKPEIIIRLMKDHKLSPRKLIFIDDHFDTLHKVKLTGVRCLFAEWGYNTVQQRIKCQELNLELVDLHQFYKEFEGL
jgi:3-deoxy-D-manno-octulosonate 8-phosphate phosphatase KdsC-like HAD superfamily phosphatase